MAQSLGGIFSGLGGIAGIGGGGGGRLLGGIAQGSGMMSDVGGALLGLFKSGGTVKSFAEGGMVAGNGTFMKGGIVANHLEGGVILGNDIFKQGETVHNYLEGGIVTSDNSRVSNQLIQNYAEGGMVNSNDVVTSQVSSSLVKNYAEGGEIDITKSIDFEIPNFAQGGLVPAAILGLAVQDAMKREGANAVPIVAHAGEEVLTTRNSDAQFYRSLKQRGVWEQMKKTQSIDNFAMGGSVGGGDFSPQRTGRRIGGDTTNVTVNMTIATPDANSFRASESQLQRDSAFRARRAYERNS